MLFSCFLWTRDRFVVPCLFGFLLVLLGDISLLERRGVEFLLVRGSWKRFRGKCFVAVVILFSCCFSTRVLLCLKRALRIANAAQQMSNVTRGSSGSVTLFVEILNKWVSANCYCIFSFFVLFLFFLLIFKLLIYMVILDYQTVFSTKDTRLGLRWFRDYILSKTIGFDLLHVGHGLQKSRLLNMFGFFTTIFFRTVGCH